MDFPHSSAINITIKPRHPSDVAMTPRPYFWQQMRFCFAGHVFSQSSS
jgi:hypothetical protein